MKTYKVYFNPNTPAIHRGKFVDTMHGMNTRDALTLWNDADPIGKRLNIFYLRFEEVKTC